MPSAPNTGPLPLCLERAPVARLIERLARTEGRDDGYRGSVEAMLAHHAERYGVPLDLAGPEYRADPAAAIAEMRHAFAAAGA